MAGRLGDLVGTPGDLAGRLGDRAGVFVAATRPRLPGDPACASAARLDGLTCASAACLDGLTRARSDVGSVVFAAEAGAGGFVTCPPVNRTGGLASALGDGLWGAAAAGRAGGTALWDCGKPPERAG
ncbi:MAG TPA: hypothetical protein VII47_15655 [Actinomycetota bacterium]